MGQRHLQRSLQGSARTQQTVSAAGRISKVTLAAQVGTAAKSRTSFIRNVRHDECARSKARDVSSEGAGLFCRKGCVGPFPSWRDNRVYLQTLWCTLCNDHLRTPPALGSVGHCST